MTRISLLINRASASQTTSFHPVRPVHIARNARFASSSAGPSCSTKRTVHLPPARYHIFKEPLPYTIGLKLQNDIIDKRLKLKADGKRGDQDIILFLEHIPTYTTGRRDNSPNPNTLHPEERKVQNVGAEFYITKRGGQVTYHGPGQLVGYPIFDLNAMELSTRCYVDYLQRILAEYCRDGLGLEVLAPHPDGHVGIFASPTEKLGSIGIHLRHRITSHGFAINLTPEPTKWFDLVVACGLDDVRAISLHQMVERNAISSGVMPPSLPGIREVAELLVPRFEAVYDRSIVDLGKDDAENDDVEKREEVQGLRELVYEAEEEARRVNARSGGWPKEPDLTRRRD